MARSLGYMDHFTPSRHAAPWQLIKSYWQLNQRYPAYLFFTIVMVMTGFFVGLDVLFNYWYYHFYYVLQAYNQHGVIRLLVVFVALVAFYLAMAVYRFFISQFFSSRWRRWLTEHFAGRWLQKRGFPRASLNLRAQKDVSLLIDYSIDFSMGLISAITTILVFVLWELPGEIVIPFGSWGSLHVPDLMWVGFIYVSVGVYFTFKLGRLFHGERKRRHKNKLSSFDNASLVRLREKSAMWFSSGYNQAYVILPLLVALPNYCNNFFLLVGLIQSLQALQLMQDSLSLMVDTSAVKAVKEHTRKHSHFLSVHG